MYVLGFAVFFVGLICGYMVYTYSGYKTEFYHIASSQVKSNVRIVFITDLEMKDYGDGNAKIIDEVKSLHPDLILSGGDLIPYSDKDYGSVLEFCKKLSKIAPFYGILGNHEEERLYLDNDKLLPEMFEKSGLHLLRNQSVTVKLGENTVELVGLSGNNKNFEKYGTKEFMDSLPSSYLSLRVVLAHIPILFKNQLSEYRFDLGLSGHTHGGLIRIPRLGGFYSAEEGFLPSVYAGEYNFEGKPVIVSRGLGDSSFVPRIHNPHELSVIDVNKY